MSVIYSYPTAAPEPADLLVGTEINSAGEDAPRTRTFTIESITALAEASAAGLYATIASVNLKAPLASPAFTGTVTGIDKTMVGLTNVDNTTDLLKPISTATQSALNLKASLVSPAFTGTVSGIDKIMVGLNNVDNTSDAAKPVSTATQTALNLKVTANTLITGATFPKITYDTKGLVISGSALIATDIPTILQSQVSNLGTDLGNLAPKASPTFTGIPLSTTAAVDTNTFQIATTAYVVNQGYAKLSGASFTGGVSSTGSVTGNSILKSGGTINQYLMASGGTTIDGILLHKSQSNAQSQNPTAISAAIPSSLFTVPGTMLKINTFHYNNVSNTEQITVTYTILDSTQTPVANGTIGSYVVPVTSSVKFSSMSRILWFDGSNLVGRGIGSSSQDSFTNTGGDNVAVGLPNTSFYVKVAVTGNVLNTTTISAFQVTL